VLDQAEFDFEAEPVQEMAAKNKDGETELGKVAEIELSLTPRPDLPKNVIQSSASAFDVMRKIWDPKTINLREEMLVMLLNRKNQLQGFSFVSKGGRAGTVIDPALVAALAVKTGAHGIILAHNHPSGKVQESNADVQVTKRMREGLKMLDVLVLDHLIIVKDAEGNWSYNSLADGGII